ncbi:MAG: hypothetical protein R3257_03195, partial [bacterium]|nr:hypothetical protein [bacterium]
MQRLILHLILIVVLPLSLEAKEWDPRLEQALSLSYGAQIPQALVVIISYRKDQPEDPNGLFVMAMVLEWQAGLGEENHQEVYKKLIQTYKEANKLALAHWKNEPQNPDTLADYGNSFFLLARMYGKSGSKMRAALTGRKSQKYLKKALSLEPDRLDILLPLGAFHYFAGKAPLIWRSFMSALGIKGDRERGLRELKQSAGGKHPYVWNARYALVEFNQKLEKNWDEALRWLQFFEKDFPKNPMVKMKRAQIYSSKDPISGINNFFELIEACQTGRFQCPKKII